MKTFKELKTVLEDFKWGDNTTSALSDEGTFYIERPDQLARINAFIESFMDRDFIDPRQAFNHLRARLNITGIDFSKTPEVVQEGNLEFEVTRQGGSFGTTPTHDLMKDGFYKDSGVPGMNFTLKADVVLGESGMYRINAKIIPSVTAKPK
ncbi:MAG: hypothetical protein H8D80_00105 [Proteobacteria bacterium]|nr:hypothetical protein [Pseudomonadota bacterium]